jgi:integrase
MKGKREEIFRRALSELGRMGGKPSAEPLTPGERAAGAPQTGQSAAGESESQEGRRKVSDEKVKRDTKPRRVRGSGSIFRKGNSRTWTIQYYREGYKQDPNGKVVLDDMGKPIRTRIRVREATGFTNQRKAQDLLTERLGQVSRGERIEHERHPATVEDLVNALRTHYEVNRVRSAESLARRWNHLKPTFTFILAANVTTDIVTRYTLLRQKQGAANATINRELAMLRRAFNLALRSTPPKVRVVPYIPLLKEDNVRRGFIEDGDFSKLAGENSELWLRTFLEIAFTYGWRKSELLGLRVRQINMDTRTIRLDAGATKNGEGREVAMTTKIAELLRQAVAGKRLDDFVLTRADGKPIRDLRKAWQNLCVRTGLGEFVCRDCGRGATKRKKCECGGLKRKYHGLIVHDFRRSAAKALRRAGVPESVIMATGGWKTPAMFRRYAIVSSSDQRAAVEMLERARAENVGPRSAPFSENRPVDRSEGLSEKLQ